MGSLRGGAQSVAGGPNGRGVCRVRGFARGLPRFGVGARRGTAVHLPPADTGRRRARCSGSQRRRFPGGQRSNSGGARQGASPRRRAVRPARSPAPPFLRQPAGRGPVPPAKRSRQRRRRPTDTGRLPQTAGFHRDSHRLDPPPSAGFAGDGAQGRPEHRRESVDRRPPRVVRPPNPGSVAEPRSDSRAA